MNDKELTEKYGDLQALLGDVIKSENFQLSLKAFIEVYPGIKPDDIEQIASYFFAAGFVLPKE